MHRQGSHWRRCQAQEIPKMEYSNQACHERLLVGPWPHIANIRSRQNQLMLLGFPGLWCGKNAAPRRLPQAVVPLIQWHSLGLYPKHRVDQGFDWIGDLNPSETFSVEEVRTRKSRLKLRLRRATWLWRHCCRRTWVPFAHAYRHLRDAYYNAHVQGNPCTSSRRCCRGHTRRDRE